VRASFLTTIASAGVLACCAAQQQQGLWLKPGASLDDFAKDKYACMQQSQQPTSAAYLGQYGGVSNSRVITNENSFGACMNASGWYLTQMTDPKGFNDALSVEVVKLVQLCSQPDLQPIFARRMACKPKDATPEQLSDRSKISEPERVALTKWRSAAEDANQKIAALDRQYEGKTGELFASQIEKTTIACAELASQLSAGHITWGEYNKGRVNIANQHLVEMTNLMHN
jgi:hypothetical protein